MEKNKQEKQCGEETKKKVKLNKSAKIIWGYVAQELDLIERATKPLKDAIIHLRQEGQI